MVYRVSFGYGVSTEERAYTSIFSMKGISRAKIVCLKMFVVLSSKVYILYIYCVCVYNEWRVDIGHV